jgi:hypothetical protein
VVEVILKNPTNIRPKFEAKYLFQLMGWHDEGISKKQTKSEESE